MAETRLRRISIWQAALLLPWITISEVVGRPFSDNSYLWHVRAGDLQRKSGTVLTEEPFSFTMAGEAWRTQSWLAELLYSWFDDRLGLLTARMVVTVSSVLLFVLLALLAYRKSKSVISAVVYLVGSSILLGAFLNPRPVIFSFPLFALLILCDDDRSLEWCSPLILWLWASLHGSFFIGLAYLALRSIGRPALVRRQIAKMAVASIAVLATAHGLGVIELLWEFASGGQALDLISEWQPPDLLEPSYVPLLLALFGLLWLAQNQRIKLREWVVLVPFLTLAFTARRSVPVAWIGIAPVLAMLTIPIRPRVSARVLPIVLGVVIVSYPLLDPPDYGVDRERFPVEAAKALSADRVFHNDVSGGWLIYEQWPDRSVYIDDRAELYQDQLRRFVETRDLDVPWRAEFDAWGIDEALLEVDAPLGRVLELEGWERKYEDEFFVVFERPTGS